MRLRHSTPTRETAEDAAVEERATAWEPLFESCIEAFGPTGCMFESNCPPDRELVDFLVLWNTCKRTAARYSADEKHALSYGTAAKAYRLNLERRDNPSICVSAVTRAKAPSA